MNMNKASRAKDYTGLEIIIKNKRVFMVNNRGAYTEIDITAAYHFLKEFFTTDWRAKAKLIKTK